jgi:ABC-type iron transport system FetAB ATPase subunit
LLPAESRWWYDAVGAHFNDNPGSLLDNVGFDSNVMNWTVSRLSSGERQRLSLVRLLCNRPDVLLLDEPTANLDHANGTRIETLLLDYSKKRKAAMIWVGHDLQQLDRIATRVYMMHNGRLKAAE